MMKMDYAKELVEMIDSDIKALGYLDDPEILERTGLKREEAKSLTLKHFKNAVLALLFEVVHMQKGGDEK